jgi:hypothetical protein
MKALTSADFRPGSRWQRTFRVEGCRVRLTCRDGTRFKVKVTDPKGDYLLEREVMARVAGLLADAHVAHGIGINIGHPSWIADHAAPPPTSTRETP